MQKQADPGKNVRESRGGAPDEAVEGAFKTATTAAAMAGGIPTGIIEQAVEPMKDVVKKQVRNIGVESVEPMPTTAGPAGVHGERETKKRP